MRAIKEVTEWDVAYRMPNHTYLVDGGKALAYKPRHVGEAIYFDHPLRFTPSYRKFIELKDNPFDVKIKSNLELTTEDRFSLLLVAFTKFM